MSPSDPIATLLDRARNELAEQFDLSKPFLVHSALGVLDVMGGISADHAGAMAVQMPIDLGAAALLQTRPNDRELQVFSFNLLDQHLPFTFRVSLDRLAAANTTDLAREFAEPGRRWAAHVAGCLYVLHEQQLIDLKNANVQGIDLATYNSIPEHAELGSFAAIQTATMKVLFDHFRIADQIDPARLAELCQRVAVRIADTLQGLREPIASSDGIPGELLCIGTQRASIERSIKLPEGFQISWISTGRQFEVESRNEKTRTATEMGQALILAKMREFGRSAGRDLRDDPTKGYLANLNPEDYKRFFRPSLPLTLNGEAFLATFQLPAGSTRDVAPTEEYNIVGALDHHILETRRVKRFIGFIEQSRALPLDNTQRFILMDKAAHLMYASHQSYMNDAMLGDAQCDQLVQLVRSREKSGLYGARMTGKGCGGTVAVLHEKADRVDSALTQIREEYQRQNDGAPKLVYSA